MFEVAKRARLRVGGTRLGKYPSDPRHWYEQRVLATPDVEETAQTATSATVAVLTSAGTLALNQYVRGPSTVIGVSGGIYGVLGSESIDSFYTARGEPHASMLWMYTALCRKLFGKCPSGEEVTLSRRRRQPLSVCALWERTAKPFQLVPLWNHHMEIMRSKDASSILFCSRCSSSRMLVP